MLHPELSKLDPHENKYTSPIESVPNRSGGVDIHQELNRLEEMVVGSPRIPLTRRTLVDEEQLLDHLDLVRLHLPEALQVAQAIVHQKEEILLQAEQYAEEIRLRAEQHAEEIIQVAEARSVQILNEMDIIQLAEMEAIQIKREVQQECAAAQNQTRSEIDQMRRQFQQELEEMRLSALTESEDIQRGADEYADGVLGNIEQQLNSMLRIIHNGRQQLHPSPQGREGERGKGSPLP